MSDYESMGVPESWADYEEDRMLPVGQMFRFRVVDVQQDQLNKNGDEKQDVIRVMAENPPDDGHTYAPVWVRLKKGKASDDADDRRRKAGEAKRFIYLATGHLLSKGDGFDTSTLLDKTFETGVKHREWPAGSGNWMIDLALPRLPE